MQSIAVAPEVALQIALLELIVGPSGNARMTEPPPTGPPVAGEQPPAGRLDSWKEIAAYLRRDVTTVQRWERREGMPVHRHLHDKLGSVYAFRTELDAWARRRSPLAGAADGAPVALRPDSGDRPAHETGVDTELERGPWPVHGESTPMPPVRRGLRRWSGIGALAGLAMVLAAVVAVWQLRTRESGLENALAGARFAQLTNFDGTEQAAALSRDGRFVAFQSNRDGRMDVWVTQIGTGQFSNLTRGGALEIVNPSVRTLGFSPDGALVTFWARGGEGSDRPAINIWAAPLLGGPPRAYLEGVAEFDWSGDGARLVYHTPGPGDPMFVRDPGASSEPRHIFSAPPGLHSHFLVWSPDQAFIYFVQGSLPDRLDIWRIRPTGGTPERITHHDSRVSHPVFLNARTLLYLVTDPDGSGPWIESIDVEGRVPRRISFGIDRYTSLSVSADGRRIVATRATPKGALWRLPMSGMRAEMSAARRIPLTTGTGTFPRLGAGYLLYVSSTGTSDSLWKLQDQTATELWSGPEARIVGAPAIRRDGGRIAFTVRRGGRTMLYLVNEDGTGARTVAGTPELQGAPAWTLDGRTITVAAMVDGIPRLVSVPLDGGSLAPLVAENSTDPVWSPAGDIVAFSGADIGTTFPVKAVKADGSPYGLPALTLTRGARHLSFTPEGRSLLVLRGGIGHKNLWLIDLETGLEHQMTDFAPGFDVRDFDLSPDGHEIVLEQVKEVSDIVLIELPRG